jgi:hypothetical protein
MRFYTALYCILMLVGCRPGPIATSTPTMPQLTGTVAIEAPITGALIYAEVIQLSGTAANLPDNQFALTLSGPDAIELARSTVQVVDGRWQIELPHSYQDVPIEVAITAGSTDPRIETPYDVVLVALAGLDYRPEGTYGSIIFPTEGSTVGGDSLQVEGLTSGLIENRLNLRLLVNDEDLINDETITIQNPYFIDEMPWSAEISTDGYTGPAILQIVDSDDTVLAAINLTVETAAG